METAIEVVETKTIDRFITEKDYELFLELRVAGKTAQQAAKIVGFSFQAFYQYQARNPEKWEAFKAKMVQPAVDTVLRASKKDWKAAGWFLERTHPNEFALTEVHRVQHTGTVKHEFEMVDRSAIEQLSGTLREVQSEVCSS